MIQTRLKTGLRVALISGVATLGLGQMAHAANDLTEAGTSVFNSFTLDYDVNSTAQDTITNNDDSTPVGAVLQGTRTEFTVDRRVDHTISVVSATVTGTPDASATVSFELLNEGNDTQSYSFSIADLDNGADTFDAGPLSIVYYLDSDDDDDFTGETGVPITATPVATVAGSADVTVDVPKGVKVLVEISGLVPGDAEDEETDGITLVAEARDPTAWIIESSGTPAAVTTATAGANTLTGAAENVLADGTGVEAAETPGSADGDGLFAATSTIEVASPDLDASKTVIAISEDSTDCATKSAEADAKAIPGACIEYVIEVENTGATVAADNLVISDTLPAQVTFVGVTLDTSTTTGFDDDPSVLGSGPTLSFPLTPGDSDCDGSTTCIVTLSDAILASTEIGQIRIRAIVK